MASSKDKLPDLPGRKDWAFNSFRWYGIRFQVRKKFHAVRLSKSSHTPPDTELPIVVVLNHPSWWDPMVGLVLSKRFPRATHYAPIESAAFRQYGFFKRLGFFGVDPGTAKGARDFLRTAKMVLSRPHAMMWVTAQGSFRDVRERPIGLRPGVGFLAKRLGRGFILPLAIEYTFWEESTPEAMFRWGEPLDISARPDLDGRAWTERIESALTAAQDALVPEVIGRDPSKFETLLGGKAGVGGVYDRWRRFKAWISGETFQAEHGRDRSGSVADQDRVSG